MAAAAAPVIIVVAVVLVLKLVFVVLLLLAVVVAVMLFSIVADHLYRLPQSENKWQGCSVNSARYDFQLLQLSLVAVTMGLTITKIMTMTKGQ